MGLFVRVIRGLGVAGLILTGVLLGPTAVPLGGIGVALAQSGSEIVVEGNRRVEAETIRSYFKPGPGGRIDAARIDAALKALYATNLFQDIRINQSGSRIIVTVVENAVINRVAFEGNHKAKDEQLQSELQSKPRGTYSKAVVQSDVQRIIDIYQRSGRYDVSVVPKIIELPNSRVDLVFEINEGAKTGVQRIQFVGNRAYSDYRLKDVIKTGQTDWFSWIKSNDFYDADRVEADRDLLRKFYLKNGYADVRVVSAAAEFDPDKKGFVITYTIDEGAQYRFGTVDIISTISNVDANALRPKLRMSPGGVYNADAIDKTVEDLTIDIAKRGYPFAVVRPRGERNFERHVVDLAFLIDEGPHTYVERINIRGNTRTRDYVIRREFDIAEGDAYNRALIDRAERRLKNLNYFKSVKITNEPGSAPDRIIINVDVEEQSTGEFSFSGGFSSADGLLGEVSVGERNLLGRGQSVRAAVQYGTRARGFDFSFVEPYFLGYRLALGLDVFNRQTLSSSYLSYTSKTFGGGVRLGIPLTDNLSTQLRYSGYSQEISLPSNLNNCNNINPDFVNTFPTPAVFPNFAAQYAAAGSPVQQNCYSDGEASLAVRRELAQGAVFTSLVGYNLTYNTLDNNRNPTSGLVVDFKQDFAGAGGDVRFIKSTIDVRHYMEVMSDVVGMARVQGGYATGWGGKELRMLDHFVAGPSMIRGFAPAGFGPRDLTAGTNNDALGGSVFWAATYELQTPLFFAPKDFGMRLAAFTDVGQLSDFRGSPCWAATGECLTLPTDNPIRASVGVGLLWDSPIGPLRFDFAYAVNKASYDRTQFFRFGGGTKF
ncbi:MAG: outer membrane protein assembly factor BamA [Xanthobacteraceae bacterium]